MTSNDDTIQETRVIFAILIRFYCYCFCSPFVFTTDAHFCACFFFRVFAQRYNSFIAHKNCWQSCCVVAKNKDSSSGERCFAVCNGNNNIFKLQHKLHAKWMATVDSYFNFIYIICHKLNAWQFTETVSTWHDARWPQLVIKFETIALFCQQTPNTHYEQMTNKPAKADSHATISIENENWEWWKWWWDMIVM